MVQRPKKAAKPETAETLHQRADTLRARMHAPDPVLAVIREGRGLMAVHEKSRRLPAPAPAPGAPFMHPEVTAASAALFDHLRGPLLETTPTSPAGGIALAKYAVELRRVLEYDLEAEARQILANIASVPLA